MQKKKGEIDYRSAAVSAASPAAGNRCCEEISIRDRGRLPHWELEDGTYFITFRLADSLPQSVLAEIEVERKRRRKLEKKSKDKSPAVDNKRMAELFSERIEEFLDRGVGECYLSDPRIATIVRDALLHFDGERYQLLAWCIMPNHVHIMLKALPGWSLPKIMHTVKSYSAKRANLILGRSGRLWQREYYDHIIRDEREYNRLLKYIIENPIRAGLEDWPWVDAVM